MKMILSEKFTLNARDFVNGLIMAVGAALLPVLNQAVLAWQGGNAFVMPWSMMGFLAMGASVTYLIKNFLTPTQVIETNPSQAKIENLKAQK